MKKWLVIGVVMLFSLLTFCTNVQAAMTTYEDVEIDAYDDESEILAWAEKGDKVDVEVTSDLAVNVYIMTSEDYSWGIGTDYSKAKHKEEEKKSVSFTYTIPDDNTYYLVIYNPNNETATVDYAYTDLFGKFVEDVDEEVEEAVWYAGMFCLLMIVIIVVVIIVIIVVIIKLGRQKEQQQYTPPPPGYGHQPPPPPPPPPRY